MIARALVRRRRLRDLAVVAVTGSVGKTTTKDLIHAVLSPRYPTAKSVESYNTAFALATTFPRVGREHRFWVAELAAGEPGALDRSLRIARPRISVVTNIRTDHCEKFLTLDATAAEKSKLVRALPPDGTAVLCADDARVAAMAAHCRGNVVTFGLGPGASVRAHDVRSIWPGRLSFEVEHAGARVPVHTRLCGEQWVYAVLAALAVGVTLGVPLAEAVRAVEGMDPPRGRFEPAETADGVTFIRDDAKGAVSTITAALEFLRCARAQRKIFVMGTLRQYLESPEAVYQATAREALQAADYVLFVGELAHHARCAAGTADGERLRTFDRAQEANEFLTGLLRPGDLVLVKGHLKTDHLARLVLARTGEVACWRDRCEREFFCDVCDLLRVAPQASGPGRPTSAAA